MRSVKAAPAAKGLPFARLRGSLSRLPRRLSVPRNLCMRRRELYNCNVLLRESEVGR